MLNYVVNQSMYSDKLAETCPKHKYRDIFLYKIKSSSVSNNTCLHSYACLWSIALCFYSQQRDEGVDGALGPHNGITGRGAKGGKGIQALQGVYEQHNVVNCQVTAYLIIHLQPNK